MAFYPTNVFAIIFMRCSSAVPTSFCIAYPQSVAHFHSSNRSSFLTPILRSCTHQSFPILFLALIPSHHRLRTSGWIWTPHSRSLYSTPYRLIYNPLPPAVLYHHRHAPLTILISYLSHPGLILFIDKIIKCLFWISNSFHPSSPTNFLLSSIILFSHVL